MKNLNISSTNTATYEHGKKITKKIFLKVYKKIKILQSYAH